MNVNSIKDGYCMCGERELLLLLALTGLWWGAANDSADGIETKAICFNTRRIPLS